MIARHARANSKRQLSIGEIPIDSADMRHRSWGCGQRGLYVDGLGQAAKSGLAFAQSFHDREDIAKRTGEPIQFPDHENVAFAELIQETVKFRPIPAPARGLLTVDAFATRSVERRYLCGGFLVVGGDASVADEHCTKVSPLLYIKQYLFAIRQTVQMLDIALRCTNARLSNEQFTSTVRVWFLYPS
jgi:hypothetical protein